MKLSGNLLITQQRNTRVLLECSLLMVVTEMRLFSGLFRLSLVLD